MPLPTHKNHGGLYSAKNGTYHIDKTNGGPSWTETVENTSVLDIVFKKNINNQRETRANFLTT
jgi:hypothetical protein